MSSRHTEQGTFMDGDARVSWFHRAGRTNPMLRRIPGLANRGSSDIHCAMTSTRTASPCLSDPVVSTPHSRRLWRPISNGVANRGASTLGRLQREGRTPPTCPTCGSRGGSSEPRLQSGDGATTAFAGCKKASPIQQPCPVAQSISTARLRARTGLYFDPPPRCCRADRAGRLGRCSGPK